MSYASAEPGDFPLPEEEPLDLVMDELDLSELDNPVDKLTDKIRASLCNVENRIQQLQDELKYQRESRRQFQVALGVIRNHR